MLSWQVYLNLHLKFLKSLLTVLPTNSAHVLFYFIHELGF